MSLGGVLVKSGEPGLYTAREAAEFKNFINRAVTYAYQKGALVITSAGNDANDGDKDRNLIHVPSDASHAMSVSATAPIGWGKNPTVFLDNPASYTNYGRSAIDIAAPGGDFQYFFVNPSELCVVAGVLQSVTCSTMFSASAGSSGLPRTSIGAPGPAWLRRTLPAWPHCSLASTER
jgi:lantibiotic leader peptide-processing serine protease